MYIYTIVGSFFGIYVLQIMYMSYDIRDTINVLNCKVQNLSYE
jgi:hypothetical protein